MGTATATGRCASSVATNPAWPQSGNRQEGGHVTPDSPEHSRGQDTDRVGQRGPETHPGRRALAIGRLKVAVLGFQLDSGARRVADGGHHVAR